MIRYLSRQGIIEINWRMIAEHGGHYTSMGNNIANPTSFEFLVEAPSLILFGVERYPNIYEKTACYAFYIIKDHVFADGNKRTGIAATIKFLRQNNLVKQSSFTKEVIIDLALSIAKGNYDIPQIAEILTQHFKPK